MSLRYYVLGSVVLVCAFYLSREMRNCSMSSPAHPSRSAPSWEPESLTAPPRHALSVPHAKQTLKERTDLEEWIQSRLTQQGLKEMTEAGHWQSEHSHAL
jgi:hypothetical protein